MAPRDAPGVQIPVRSAALHGDITVPDRATGIVLFAHGSGSSRLSPRNRSVARRFQEAGLATLLFDLLTPAEEEVDEQTREYRFDIELLADRLVEVTDWVTTQDELKRLNVGYFGASTGAAAALFAAARRPEVVRAVVSRGGRPDLAAPLLGQVRAPTLLIVGGLDDVVIGMNEEALAQLRTEKSLEIVPGATHLFSEEGALETVGRLAADWFTKHLA